MSDLQNQSGNALETANLVPRANIPDSIKRPVPDYKYENNCNPHLVDLVEGNLRNRMIFPLVALALYITLVFQLTNTAANVSAYQ